MSIAAHSPLMASVVAEYRAARGQDTHPDAQGAGRGQYQRPPPACEEDMRSELAGQLTWPVRWTDSVQWMIDQGVTRIVEVGPGTC